MLILFFLFRRPYWFYILYSSMSISYFAVRRISLYHHSFDGNASQNFKILNGLQRTAINTCSSEIQTWQSIQWKLKGPWSVQSSDQLFIYLISVPFVNFHNVLKGTDVLQRADPHVGQHISNEPDKDEHKNITYEHIIK